MSEDGKEDYYPDQEYCYESEKTGQFRRLVEQALSQPSCPKVPVTYGVANTSKENCPLRDYKRTRMVPKALVEKANYDKDFDQVLMHCIAHSYRDEMLSVAEQRIKKDGGNFVCDSCGKNKPTHFVQVPTDCWHIEPYEIKDVAGIMLCDEKMCDVTAKQKFVSNMNELTKFVKTTIEDSGQAMCDCCNLLKDRDDLNRCSRCKKVYYCDTKCQKLAWKRHKKVCRAAPSSAEEDDAEAK
jgi:hypothetical protein